MTVRVLTLLFIACLAASCASAPPRPQPAQRPRLVVILVVDQMRTSYVEDYGAHFTGGLRRLLDEGAWFRQASYPYLNTVTCPGHATIGTGALPYRHGMVLNGWWNRETGRSQLCTADDTTKNIAYEGISQGGDSAASLLVATLAQQIRERTGGRSVALSLKPRSAISLAGTGTSAVVWFDERAAWMTSEAFTPGPIAWLQQYFSRRPYSADRGNVWERLLPLASYRGQDAGLGERAPAGWTTAFPHRLEPVSEHFTAQWQRSPFADEYLGRLAAHALDTLNLGRGSGTDFLGVSFSTLDLVGHQFGPRSHEVQDILFHLDRAIGALLDILDRRLGRDAYVLGFSSDHGVAVLPEQSGGSRQPSGEVVSAINSALQPYLGAGRHVVHSAYTDIYLAPGLSETVRASRAASDAVRAALVALPGIAHAFFSDELRDEDARRSADPVKRAAALSHYPPRSGDIVIVPKENWLLSTAATTHGTLYPYDQQVPVIFFGAGVRAGVLDAAATPADIAPTLAALAGVPFQQSDGKPLIQPPRSIGR